MEQAILRRYAAQRMLLAPHVRNAIYKGKPLPIGWRLRLNDRLGSIPRDGKPRIIPLDTIA